MSKEKHLILKAITLSQGERTLIRDFSHTFTSADRVGILGVNGAGKTTLLNILHERPDLEEGQIITTGNLKTGLVKQLHEDAPGTVWDILEHTHEELVPLRDTLRLLEEKMAEGDTSAEIMDHYAESTEQYTNLGGYTLASRIHQILTGLTFPKHLWEAPVKQLSGGERTKVALAQMLLLKPDILLLDEPTNFLDIAAMEWLEYTLINHWKQGFIVVSHDRYFLDRVTTSTLELLEERTPLYFPFPYQKYMEVRETHMNAERKAYEHQEMDIARQEEIVRRLRAGSRGVL